MSTGEKKPATAPATAPSPTTPSTAKPGQQTTPPAPQASKPKISRRTFIKVAMGASVVLAGASFATSGQILSPLVPTPKGDTIITNAASLESQYDAIRGQTGQVAYQFYYWPYDPSVSPYYKNVVVRIPDELLDPSIRGSTPNLAHYESWNLTCVHLRCIVNPGYDLASGQYRLRCPCHGSQYKFIDCCRTEYPLTGSGTVIPVAGPAYDLGLRPLPRILLRLDATNNIVAYKFDGDPGIGRTD